VSGGGIRSPEDPSAGARAGTAPSVGGGAVLFPRTLPVGILGSADERTTPPPRPDAA